MGDSAEFEKLTELEARLATALDRIAAAQQVPRAVEADAPGAGDAAREEAEARAADLSERVALLESQLAETQDALSDAMQELTQTRADLSEAQQVPASTPNDAATADLETRLSEAEAARAQADAALSEKETELAAQTARAEESAAALADAEARLAEQADTPAELSDTPVPDADGAAAADPDVEDMEKALAVMTRRVERARAERDAARKACDEATDLADELREAMGETPEARVLELRRQLRLMKARAEDLAAQLAIVNSGADPSMVDQTVLTELETLRQLRAADAAELDRIIADVEASAAAAGGGSAHA